MTKSVTISADFTGYPDDTAASETRYKAGATVDLDDTFADLIIGKGLAAETMSAGEPTKNAPAVPTQAPTPATAVLGPAATFAPEQAKVGATLAPTAVVKQGAAS